VPNSGDETHLGGLEGVALWGAKRRGERKGGCEKGREGF
jgi:hypothetical protein